MTQSEDGVFPNEEQFRGELIQSAPFLRAFARVLCGRVDQANDLSQEAIGEAWERRASLAPGANLKAGLFKILRNNYYARRGIEWSGSRSNFERDNDLGGDASLPNGVELQELAQALAMLSDEQREALILVGASGFAYKEAASICDCAVGTIKSRVARARSALHAALNEPNDGNGADQIAEDGDLAETNVGVSSDQDIAHAAQLNSASLYARRLMGASRRILH